MNKLQRLHDLRQKAGIIFDKSFRCKDAEKNIHLVDKNEFFKKFLKKLKDKGYIPADDFDFEVIRSRINYAERHHIKQSYEWKYFYSTTFTISDELIDYLLRHYFIFRQEELQRAQMLGYIKTKKQKAGQVQPLQPQKPTPPKKTVEQLEKEIENSRRHVLNFTEKIKQCEESGDYTLYRNYQGALHKNKEQLAYREGLLAQLKEKMKNDGDDGLI